MTATHTTRGKVTERMVVRWMRENGFPGAERIVRTGYRTALRTAGDEGDIGMAPGCLAQVKALRPVNRAERAVPGWLAETEAQRVAAGAEVALLVVRRDGTGDVGEWWAWLPLRKLPGIQPPHLPRLAWRADVPVRLLVADACRLLRSAGYGEPDLAGAALGASETAQGVSEYPDGTNGAQIRAERSANGNVGLARDVEVADGPL